ncbi:MAG: YchJ family protein [Chitinispirillales bacterium]|jgi:SEC-C motif-containing protein|nr:YchJ family protein [Chitinispirillales bacterium]
MTDTDKNGIDSCPCFSDRPYSDCCEPVVSGARPAETALELMRARYSAYATGGVEFIVSSTHPSRQSECDERAIRSWSANSEWTGFDIISISKGEAKDREGSVEFVARFTEDRMKKTLHETATFKRGDDKQWYYVDGTIHPPKPFIRPEEDKINRNDPCPCGSGKKHKKCCMGN